MSSPMRSACAPSTYSPADGPLLAWLALAIGLAAIGHFCGRRCSCRFTPCGGPARRTRAFALLHCTGGDILITAATFVGAAALARAFRWPLFGWHMALAAVILGAAYTILSEWLNVEIRRSWSYTAAMPVLPWLGTGLTPLLQWLIVPGLALAIIGDRYRRARRPMR